MTVDRIESVLQLHGRSDIDILLARYLTPGEVGGDGEPAAGAVNIKRIYGHPADFRVVVRAMAGTVPSATGAIGSADAGSMPLATAVAWTLGLPAVFIHDDPRRQVVTYGDTLAPDGESLLGERLEPETLVHVVDDKITTGETAARAVSTYRGAGLFVDEMSAVLGGAPEEQLVQLAAGMSLTILHILVRR